MGLGYIDINGEKYLPIGAVAKLVGKTSQMIRLWDMWSDDLALNGSERLIPQSTRVGPNQVRYWTIEQVDSIITFSQNIKYGDIAEFSRQQWGERGENLKFDKSSQARALKQEIRSNINSNSKKIQRDKKAKEIKEAKGNMLKTIRRRARSIYQDQ